MIKKIALATDLFITDPILFFKEIQRRITKKPVKYKGFIIKSRGIGVLYYVKKYKDMYNLITEEEDAVLIDKKHNIKIAVSKESISLLATVLLEDSISLRDYKLSKEEIENKKVLDVGAYIGDTVLGFLIKGAKYVVGYEPVFYEYAMKNIEINGFKDKAEIRPYGLSYNEDEINVKLEGSATGLHEGDFIIKTRPWKDLLEKEKFDLAKVDCEGCEYYLLSVPDELLSSIPLWVIEIHGVSLPLIRKFENAGFRYEFIKKFNELAIIYRFELIK